MIKIKPQDVYEILSEMYNDSGWVNGAVKVKAEDPCSINIEKIQDTVSITFSGSLPKIAITKLTLFSVRISNIVLRPNGGTVVLQGFPDINFKYEK